MKTFDELQADEQSLKAQLLKIEADKVEAAERQRAEQIDAIAQYEDQATAYRNQAAKAASEDDKKRLYQYAEDADEQALQLRKELGLLPDGLPTEAERVQAKKLKTLRSINGLLLKAMFAFVAYLFADFTSGKLEMGFISFALKSTAQIFYCITAALGSVWLVCISLYAFVSGYCVNDLKTDFQSLSPTARLSVLAALLAAILHFLTAVVPHAN
ncbi:hypothetical protein BN8_01347 [Fibrisoma limi BUZ 3]|uniref:Uncharacterized protein n=1 Tax=Fibrisoma limi BUZ 3 TaxID=1185876 RepID=I2GEM6_9BACT|nr:hypothetical protein [Fibrisoma limi]CCH52351.1 hypothetical protein BN8_01347 [Fibrisoma limi BUZ 3]